MKTNIENLIVKSIQLSNRIRSPFYITHNKSNKNALEGALLSTYNKQRPFGPLPKLCYAPWNNIFFNTHGKAIVCCKNTKIILGTYPENSIHDIWFGEKIQLLREKILQNDLSLGCYKCHEAIKQNNISSMTSVYYDKYGMMFPK
ncbi:MAG: SPASM domain-containing protein, partial [Bacteroidales bacterium]|nr:SPASM domain-containing protein [Bacteroidales bacterium]